MIVHAIKHLELFEVPNINADKSYFGCAQEWYDSEWQRLSGCGPTAASNIIYYLGKTRPYLCSMSVQNNKADCLALMEEVWAYVTPTEEGIDTTMRFYESLQAYFDSVGFRTAGVVCDVPENREERPKLRDMLDYLVRAMDKDAPVAFLNLCNGEETNLEAWHWVTVVSLEYSDNKENIYLTILDEGQNKKIDLILWYNSTVLGGGFVYFV